MLRVVRVFGVIAVIRGGFGGNICDCVGIAINFRAAGKRDIRGIGGIHVAVRVHRVVCAVRGRSIRKVVRRIKRIVGVRAIRSERSVSFISYYIGGYISIFGFIRFVGKLRFVVLCRVVAVVGDHAVRRPVVCNCAACVIVFFVIIYGINIVIGIVRSRGAICGVVIVVICVVSIISGIVVIVICIIIRVISSIVIGVVIRVIFAGILRVFAIYIGGVVVIYGVSVLLCV